MISIFDLRGKRSDEGKLTIVVHAEPVTCDLFDALHQYISFSNIGGSPSPRNGIGGSNLPR